MNIKENLLNSLSEQIIQKANNKIFKVAIDGLDGAGKTYFANELGAIISNAGKSVIRSSTDFFHNPKKIRYQLGKNSPEGFFKDSYNYLKLKELLLNPLTEGKATHYYTKYFNLTKDEIEMSEPININNNIILIFDGIFLHRNELIQYWDYSIFLDVSREESLMRCYKRDKSGSPNINAISNKRYVEGQKIYLSECNPKMKANIVINNENLDAPYIQQ